MQIQEVCPKIFEKQKSNSIVALKSLSQGKAVYSKEGVQCDTSNPNSGSSSKQGGVITYSPLTIKGTDSFKVLKECPLIVMLLSQIHTSLIQGQLKDLLPIMVTSLKLRAPLSACLLQKQLFKDLIACMVVSVNGIV